jgi:hypothetical protein
MRCRRGEDLRERERETERGKEREGRRELIQKNLFLSDLSPSLFISHPFLLSLFLPSSLIFLLVELVMVLKLQLSTVRNTELKYKASGEEIRLP